MSYGWQTFKPYTERDELWDLHDSFVEDGKDKEAYAVRLVIAMGDMNKISPSHFIHGELTDPCG